MADYKHGAYGQINAVGSKAATNSPAAMVYIGTAPVHTVVGGASNVNTPIVVNNIAEARSKFGYSDDFASYTLCEAMRVHFESKGVGPLIFINVLDPAKHKADKAGSITKKPENGVVTIPEAESIIQDTVVVKSGEVEKKRGTDFSLSYSIDRKTLTLTELSHGALGTTDLTITYSTVDPSKVTAEDVIGSTDGMGLNKGVYALISVYPLTGYTPSFVVAPGFSSIPAVHAAMAANTKKINKHWDAYMFVDLPIVTTDGTAVTLDTVKKFKDANGYNRENETVYFPMAKGTDGKKFHLSVLAAANFQELLLAQDGIPYRTASNTSCSAIENLYLGEAYEDRVCDDAVINEKLNKNGIASAAYIGGRWAIWGAHSADYDQSNGTDINVAETNRMMLYYISNDFQARRMLDIDKPTTPNDIKTIVSEEQARLDALLNIGALIYGQVSADSSADAKSDLLDGDFTFSFNATTTPLAKSMTAIVSWTDDGFITYFADSES